MIQAITITTSPCSQRKFQFLGRNSGDSSVASWRGGHCFLVSFNSSVGIQVIQAMSKIWFSEEAISFNSSVGIQVIQAYAYGRWVAIYNRFQFLGRNSGDSSQRNTECLEFQRRVSIPRSEFR